MSDAGLSSATIGTLVYPNPGKAIFNFLLFIVNNLNVVYSHTSQETFNYQYRIEATRYVIPDN